MNYDDDPNVCNICGLALTPSQVDDQRCRSHGKPEKVTIDPGNGHPPIDCYGEWRWDSNCSVAAEPEWLDGIYADGGKDWEAVAKELAAWAQRADGIIVELVAC